MILYSMTGLRARDPRTFGARCKRENCGGVGDEGVRKTSNARRRRRQAVGTAEDWIVPFDLRRQPYRHVRIHGYVSTRRRTSVRFLRAYLVSSSRSLTRRRRGPALTRRDGGNPSGYVRRRRRRRDKKLISMTAVKNTPDCRSSVAPAAITVYYRRCSRPSPTHISTYSSYIIRYGP